MDDSVIDTLLRSRLQSSERNIRLMRKYNKEDDTNTDSDNINAYMEDKALAKAKKKGNSTVTDIDTVSTVSRRSVPISVGGKFGMYARMNHMKKIQKLKNQQILKTEENATTQPIDLPKREVIPNEVKEVKEVKKAKKVEKVNVEEYSIDNPYIKRAGMDESLTIHKSSIKHRRDKLFVILTNNTTFNLFALSITSEIAKKQKKLFCVMSEMDNQKTMFDGVNLYERDIAFRNLRTYTLHQDVANREGDTLIMPCCIPDLYASVKLLSPKNYMPCQVIKKDTLGICIDFDNIAPNTTINHVMRNNPVNIQECVSLINKHLNISYSNVYLLTSSDSVRKIIKVLYGQKLIAERHNKYFAILDFLLCSNMVIDKQALLYDIVNDNYTDKNLYDDINKAETTYSHGNAVIIAGKDENDLMSESVCSWLMCSGITELIVVDWNSHRPYKKTLTQDPKIKIIRVIDEDDFCLSRAYNLGVSKSSSINIILADVNVKCDHRTVLKNKPSDSMFYSNVGSSDDFDLISCKKKLFMDIGGFNENLFNGYEFTDLHNRLVDTGTKNMSTIFSNPSLFVEDTDDVDTKTNKYISELVKWTADSIWTGYVECDDDVYRAERFYNLPRECLSKIDF